MDDFGQIPDGTAIGMAVAGAANRLRDSEAKTKLIILLTDGVNNRGQIDPITAASRDPSTSVGVPPPTKTVSATDIPARTASPISFSRAAM